MILLSALCLFPAMVGPTTPASTARALADANAQAVRVTLIDPALRARSVELVRVHTPAGAEAPARCIFMDPKVGGGGGGRITLDSPADFPLAIAPDDWIIAEPADLLAPRAGAAPAQGTPSRLAPAAPWIDLVDGQRIVGSPARGGAVEPDASGQSIRWTHPRLGVQEVPLDRIRRLVLGPPATNQPGADAADTDTVLLRNGDRVSGYVDAIGADITITPAPTTAPGANAAPDSPAEPLHIALDQVALATLANPAARPTGVMLYLADGGLVAADRLDIDAAGARVTLSTRGPDQPPTGPGGSLDLADLRAVALDASRLTSLSSLKLVRHAPAGHRRLAESPRITPVGGGGGAAGGAGSLSPLGADDIVLPGPMLVEWELPAGAARLAGWVTLEPASWSWGDCTVTISIVEPGEGGRGEAGNTLAVQRLTGRMPIMPVNVEFSAPESRGVRLRITVDPGEDGPVLDRVRLRRMLVATTPEPHPAR